MNDSQPAAGESNVRGDNKEIREDSIEDNDELSVFDTVGATIW